MSKTLLRAFALEALANTFTLPLLISPRSILPYLVSDPSTINPLTILLARLFAGVVIGALTPPLLLGLRDDEGGRRKDVIEGRRIAYVLLGLGEVLLIPVLVGHALEVSSSSSSGGSVSGMGKEGLMGMGEQGGFTPFVAWNAVASLVPPLAWRVWVLWFRPEMLSGGGQAGSKRD